MEDCFNFNPILVGLLVERAMVRGGGGGVISFY